MCNICTSSIRCCFMCAIFRIRCNPMHPLYGAMPSFVPVLVTRCASIAHRYTYPHLRCRTSQYLLILFPTQYLWRTILVTCPRWCETNVVLRAGPMSSYWSKLLDPFLSSTDLIFSYFCLWVGLWLIGCQLFLSMSWSLMIGCQLLLSMSWSLTDRVSITSVYELVFDW